MGYREGEDGKVFVKIRNPWGGEGKDGTSEMTIDEFRQTFVVMTVEPK